MRALLAFLLVLGVGGCTDREWSHVKTFVGDSDRSPLAPMPAQLNPRCHEVASDRASDVVAQGFDAETAQGVFNAVYADCVAWAQRGSDVR